MSDTLWVRIPGRVGASEEWIRADQIIALYVVEHQAGNLRHGVRKVYMLQAKVFPHDTERRQLVAGLASHEDAAAAAQQFLRACAEFRGAPAVLTFTPHGVEITSTTLAELP